MAKKKIQKKVDENAWRLVSFASKRRHNRDEIGDQTPKARDCRVIEMDYNARLKNIFT